MFQPSKRHLQGARLICYQSTINKICTRHKIQFSKQRVLSYVKIVYSQLQISRVRIGTCKKLTEIDQLTIYGGGVSLHRFEH
jgi:hypothetical protein